MRITTRVLAGFTLLAGLAGSTAAQDADPLTRKPIQQGVVVADTAGLKAEEVAWPKPPTGAAPTGVIVKDAQGRIVRQFIDTTGQKKPNIFSFYVNGVEAYREVDSKGSGKPDQFRWLGPNGGKWGQDLNGDGVVDNWISLSPEELSQELFQVLVTKDARRLTPLLPTEPDLKKLGLPAGEINSIMQRSQQAGARIQKTMQDLKLTTDSKWVHLELGLPYVTPGDSFGGPEDLVRHKSAHVLFDLGDGKTVNVFQTGEMIQIGRVWKLIDGPAAGAAQPGGAEAGDVLPQAVQPLIAELEKVRPPENGTAEMWVKYHTDRTAVLEKVVAQLKGAHQEPFLRQVIDAYAAAAELKDAAARKRLELWVATIEQTAPNSPAAAYAAFRSTSAEYAIKLGALGPAPKEEEVKVVQKWWRDALEAYITKYKTAPEETPEAMLRLAIAHEYAGRDGETAAKDWYERLAREFKTHPYAARAAGAVQRLGSEGQRFVLNGQTLQGRPYDVGQHAGKVVVVYYYWAAFGFNTAAELKYLAQLQSEFGAKGLEVVTVSLDDNPAKATDAINAAQLLGAGTHLLSPGGTDRSPLAIAYGIQMVPHVFVVGKDGKVTNRNAQIVGLKDEVEKLLK